MCIQYRRSLPYRADRSARYGKGRLYCMRVLYVYVTVHGPTGKPGLRDISMIRDIAVQSLEEVYTSVTASCVP